MKWLFVFVLCFSGHMVTAQLIGLDFSLLTNKYFDMAPSEGRDRSSYSSVPGFSVSLVADELFKEDWDWQFGFELRYEKYGGSVDTYTGGQGSGTGLSGNYTRHDLHFTVYPFRIRLGEIGALNLLGLDFGWLIDEDSDLTLNRWAIGSESERTTDASELLLENSFALVQRLTFKLELADSWYIGPQYKMYITFGDQFYEDAYVTFSFRNHIGVILSKSFY